MLYFPMIDTVWPDWIPLIGGNNFQFFRPVFNVADSSITVGMFILLIFYRDFFSGSIKPPVNEEEKAREEIQPLAEKEESHLITILEITIESEKSTTSVHRLKKNILLKQRNT